MSSRLLEKFVKSLIINRTYPKDPANFDINYRYHNDQYNFTNEDLVHITIWFEENIDKNRSLDSSEEWYSSDIATRKRIINLLLNTYVGEYASLTKKNLTHLKKLLKKMLYVTQSAIHKKENTKGLNQLYNGVYDIMYSFGKPKLPKRKLKSRKKLKTTPEKKKIVKMKKKKIVKRKKKKIVKRKYKSMKNLSPQKAISSKLTVAQLKREAKKREIKGYSKLKKNQLLALF